MRRSVALAAYNGGEFIRQQIESVLSQLGPDDELIVSDDGSTDNTRDIVAEYVAYDPRVQLVEGPCQGPIRNFEHALELCGGDIIFLCDQDDVWLRGKVEACTAALEDPDVWLVLHDAHVTNKERLPLRDSFFEWHGSQPGFRENLVRNSFMGCCMAFRRELLDLALPFPKKIPMHDQWIGLLAEARGKGKILPRPLLDYRRHGGNVTADHHGPWLHMIRNRYRIWRALHRRLRRA